MLVTAPSQKELIVSPPEFQLDPPSGNPFGAVPTASVTSVDDSFDLRWAEKPAEPSVLKSEQILERIVERSRVDAERFPASGPAHANYALALMNCGNLAGAAEEFERALELSPQQFMCLANLARIRTSQGRFAEAEKLFQQLSETYPRELSPLVNLSYIFLRAGNIDRANEILKRAVEVDPDAVLPRFLMAVSLLILKRPHEAISHLRFAARHDVRSPSVHQALGVAYMMAGDMKGAVRSFRSALSLAPDMRDAVHALANVLLERGDRNNLIELLAAYVEKQPSDVGAREILAYAYSEARDFPRARLELTSALRYIVGDGKSDRMLRAKLLNNVGVCFDRQMDFERAMQWYERSVAVEPALSPIPYLNMARILRQRSQFGQAWRLLQACEATFPTDDNVSAMQAWLLGEQKRYDEAIELLRKKVSSGAGRSSSYAILGWYLTDEREDLPAAIEILQEGFQKYPRSPALVNNLAYVLLMSGKPSEARSVLSSLADAKYKASLNERVTLTATWGLLHLWERDIPRGTEFYRRAEAFATDAGDGSLSVAVRQKMHLELARAYVREGLLEDARSEIKRGLSVNGGREYYRRDLMTLRDRLLQ